MLAALLDKMFGIPGTAPSTDPGPAPAAQEPPAPRPGAPMTENDFKGIPSGAFFFGWTPEQYQLYLLRHTLTAADAAQTAAPRLGQEKFR